MNREVLTLREVAEYLRMSRSTIYRLVQKGQIPAIKIASQWRFKKGVLDEWLETQLKREAISRQTGLSTDETSHGNM